MEYKDYYKSLGVEKTSGKEEIKKQYRKLARQYHPDVNTTDKNASAKFAEISEAYEVLSDDEKRRKYDALGSDWEQSQNAGQGEHFDWSKYTQQGNSQSGGSSRGWEDIFGGTDASDFFKSMFGQGFANQGNTSYARPGQDLKARLTLSLEEAYAGGVRNLTVGEKQIRLNLLPGIWDRQTIKINGKGAPGDSGTESGDLFLTFLLQVNAEYRLDGVDLYKNLHVSIFSALLGNTVNVQAISGTFKLKIPAGTKNGTVFKLKGKGFPVYGKAGTFGDLFLKVSLQLPENLTPQEKTMFRELAVLRNEKVEG